MKKTIAISLLLALMLPAVSYAEPCIVECSGGGHPMLLTMSWGLTGYQTPVIKPGESVTDIFGNVHTCPAWFPSAGCFDLTKTAYFLAQFAK